MSIFEPSHEKNNNLCFRPSRHKPVCRDTEAALPFKKQMDCTFCLVKNKDTEQLRVIFDDIAKLVCAFVFANANRWFCGAVAQMENHI